MTPATLKQLENDLWSANKNPCTTQSAFEEDYT